MSRAKASAQSNEIVTHIFHEIKLHIEYCKGFGISIEEIESTPEKQGKFLTGPERLLNENPHLLITPTRCS